MKKILLIGIIVIFIIIGIYIFIYPSLPVKKCPSTNHIDCMPSVGHLEGRYCNSENRAWIQDNCPNIFYTD